MALLRASAAASAWRAQGAASPFCGSGAAAAAAAAAAERHTLAQSVSQLPSSPAAVWRTMQWNLGQSDVGTAEPSSIAMADYRALLTGGRVRFEDFETSKVATSEW